MPVTYCRDCVYCVDRTAYSGKYKCFRRPPTTLPDQDQVQVSVHPTVELAFGFCGDGEAKPKIGKGDTDCPVSNCIGCLIVLANGHVVCNHCDEDFGLVNQ